MNSQNKDWWRKADIQRAVFSPDWEPTLTFLKKRAHKIEDGHPRILRWDVQKNLFSYASPSGLSFDGILVFCGFIANLKEHPIVIIKTQQGAEELKCSVYDNLNSEYLFPLSWNGSSFLLEVSNLPDNASFSIAFLMDRSLTEAPQFGRLDNAAIETDQFTSSVFSTCIYHIMSFRVLFEFNNLIFGDEKIIKKSAEIGCGHGILSSIISSFSRKHIALDIHDSEIVYFGYPVFDRLLSRVLGVRVDRRENFDYVKHDARTFNFEKESLDLVVSQSCFEHISESEGAFFRIAEGLRPGGKAIIVIDHNYSLIDMHRPYPSNDKRAWWHLRCTPEEIEETYKTCCTPKEATSRIAFYKTCNLLTYHDYMNIGKEINACFPDVSVGIIPFWVTAPYQWLARDLLRQRLEKTFLNRERYSIEDLLNEIIMFYMKKEAFVNSTHKSKSCPECGQAILGSGIMVTCESCGSELAYLSYGAIKAKPSNISANFAEFEDFIKILSAGRPDKLPVFDVVLFLKTSLESAVFQSSDSLGRQLHGLEGFRVLVIENAVNMESLSSDTDWFWLNWDDFPVGVIISSPHIKITGDQKWLNQWLVYSQNKPLLSQVEIPETTIHINGEQIKSILHYQVTDGYTVFAIQIPKEIISEIRENNVVFCVRLRLSSSVSDSIFVNIYDGNRDVLGSVKPTDNWQTISVRGKISSHGTIQLKISVFSSKNLLLQHNIDIQIAKVSLLFNELDGWTIYEYEAKPETGGYHG